MLLECLQSLVNSINAHRLLRRAGMVRDASIDLWLCVFIIGR